MFSLALLNGGIGARVGSDRPKQFIRVNAKPAIVYSLVAAEAVPSITQIVINYPEGWRDDVEKVIRDYAIKTPVVYVAAGASRQESVWRMLDACSEEQVIIHESARPLVTPEDFQRLIDSPHDNVAMMAPIPFTVAPVDPAQSRVTGYLDRDTLRNVQLPQKFSRTTLLEARDYAMREGVTFTEEATL
jgi:2-C-methyl-D-erythritol 4-phosphate cytidylyltransferase